VKLIVHDEEEMLFLGGKLARACRNPAIIYLRGQLGAGKTTLVRGFMRGMGYGAPVKSPTYTLVEPYDAAEWRVYHLDLYRIREAEELAHLGLRELQGRNVIVLVEWPERGEGLLPPADVALEIEYAETGRIVSLESLTTVGKDLLERIATDFSPA
jgi:tRNA threonylcarbamoyladenosine biosynthesis protein TsaE